MNQRREIVPVHLSIQAMRDNGYKNAAYALAELIDNSIEAGATEVTVYCEEKKDVINRNAVSYIERIYVIDNGSGMTPDVLGMSLQFGNGTRLEKHLQKGMGKYGMGLPNSSISQCRRVEVYSWTDGPESVHYTYLDVEEIRRKNLAEIPDPVRKEIPDVIRNLNIVNAVSGTIVVWSELDRLNWRRASTLIRNSEMLLGRLYRKFINEHKVKIRMISALSGSPDELTENKLIIPNDPIYLMERTSCPEPFHDRPMFEPFNHEKESNSVIQYIKFRGAEYPVTLHFTVAKNEARNGFSQDPGSMPHGKHADKNKGISIVRAGREIELDTHFCNSYDPTERWWGIEIEFSSELDELFGLTNNKQNVRYFSDIFDSESEEMSQLPFAEKNNLEESMESLEDSRLALRQIHNTIKSNLSAMRKHLKSQRENTRSRKNAESMTPDSPEIKGTKATEVFRKEEGYETQTDRDAKNLSKTKRTELLKEGFIQKGTPEKDAFKTAANVVNSQSRYVFITQPMDSYAFFTIEPRAGVIQIVLNSSHPAYENLMELTLEDSIEDLNQNELVQKLRRTRDALKLLLEAWAEYEEFTSEDSPLKEKIKDIRQEWGKRAKKFLSY